MISRQMTKSLSGILASRGISPSKTTSEVNSKNTTTMSNKEIVGAFLSAVLQNDTVTMRRLANVDYIQHTPFLPTGLEPFIQMLPVLQENGTTAENIRMFQDGTYVFVYNIWR